jgi:hypothetical protein
MHTKLYSGNMKRRDLLGRESWIQLAEERVE